MIIPEYRGYSLLKCYQPDIDLIKTDMRYFVKELERKGVIEVERTILFGKSLGSHLASYLSSRFTFHSCILFCGIVSVSKIVEAKTNSFLGSMIKQNCDNFPYLSKILCPLLIIHGEKDDLIPYLDIVDMVNRLNENVKYTLYIGKELEHNSYSELEDIFNPVSDFYANTNPFDRIIDDKCGIRNNPLGFSRIENNDEL